MSKELKRDITVVLSEEGAKKWTVRLVGLVGNLHLQIDNTLIIQSDIDIQADFFVFNGLTQNDGISDLNGMNLRFVQMEQESDQTAQDFIVGLQDGAEI